MFLFILTFSCYLFFERMGICGIDEETQPPARRISTGSCADLFAPENVLDGSFENNPNRLNTDSAVPHLRSFPDFDFQHKQLPLDQGNFPVTNWLLSKPFFPLLEIQEGKNPLKRKSINKRKKHQRRYKKSGEYRLAKEWLTFVNQVTDASLPKNITSLRLIKPGKERQTLYKGIANKLRSWIHQNPTNKEHSLESEARFWDFQKYSSKSRSRLVFVNTKSTDKN